VFEDKIVILSFLELIFIKTGKNKRISFKDVSEATLIDTGKVRKTEKCEN
jgi:hypothetical protein